MKFVLCVALLVGLALPSVPAAAAAPAQACWTYTVQRGDTLSEIAARYGVTVAALMSANHLHGTVIYAGQHLCIPAHAPAPPPQPLPCGPVSYGTYPCQAPPMPPPCGYTYHQLHPCAPWPGVQVIVPHKPFIPSAGLPCSKPFENESNLCVESPYPVPFGTTASVVWRIADFVEGCFDMGDGRGCVGPIYREQRVGVANVTGPRTLRLVWKDHAGNTRSDSMVMQVTPGVRPHVTYQPGWGPSGPSDR